MKIVVEEQHKPYGLHRLGIAAHVFVDTWAHQGFAGVSHRVNDVNHVRREKLPDPHFKNKLVRFFGSVFQEGIAPIGHSAALSYPDRPFLRWSYENGLNERVERDNPKDFTDAADELCKWIRRFVARDAEASVKGLPDSVREIISNLFTSLDDGKPSRRHQKWLKAISDDAFGIGAVNLDYRPKGVGSWKHKALGVTTKKDSKKARFPFSKDFLTCDWRLFHDAAKAHRLSVVDDVLPRYGICVV